MALVRWEPAREISSLQSEMNRLFSSFFEPAAATPDGVRRWVPPMDLVEQDDHYVLQADLPGIAEQDVNVEVDGDVLTISGERRSEHEASKDGYRRVERAYGAFRRSLSLPDGIDPKAVAAHVDKGVLTVTIPKPEQRRPHTVQVGVTSAPAAAQTIEGAAAPIDVTDTAGTG